MINVFIPHRWNNDDYAEISALLDRTKFNVRDYSIPKFSPLNTIDWRYNVDPKIQQQIKHASVVVCSNRPANYNGKTIEEIEYALKIGKPVVAVKITDSTSAVISSLGIDVIPKRKDLLESWITRNT